jgi:hypothetical protein
VWGTDWPATIAILDAYRSRYPDDGAAQQKLYAALLDYAGLLLDDGQSDAAVEQLLRASSLAPDQDLAQATLTALSPTPTPVVESRIVPTAVVRAITPTPRPAPVQAQTAPQPPVVVATPTKVSIGSGVRPAATPTKTGLVSH